MGGGWVVEVIDVTDVMDEFSWLHESPIRYIRYKIRCQSAFRRFFR